MPWICSWTATGPDRSLITVGAGTLHKNDQSFHDFGPLFIRDANGGRLGHSGKFSQNAFYVKWSNAGTRRSDNVVVLFNNGDTLCAVTRFLV